MSKLKQEVIRVKCDSVGRPLRLEQAGCVRNVSEWLDCWADTGCWWEDESCKRFYRLQLADGRVWEIYRDETSGKWYWYKTYD